MLSWSALSLSLILTENFTLILESSEDVYVRLPVTGHDVETVTLKPTSSTHRDTPQPQAKTETHEQETKC